MCWTKAEDDFLSEKYLEGLSIKEIVLGFDERTEDELKQRLRQLNLNHVTIRQKDGKFRCSSCKEYKDTRFFPKNKSKKHGIGAYCKECFNKKYRNKRTFVDVIKELTKKDVVGSDIKVCTKCNKTKSVEEFYWEKKYKKVSARCKECDKIRSLEYTSKRFREKGF